jgi:hypothetical protein
MAGTCPKCESSVTRLVLETLLIKGRPKDAPSYHGVTFSCPSCGCVLGAGFDPLAVKNDIVEEVVHHLRKG